MSNLCPDDIREFAGRVKAMRCGLSFCSATIVGAPASLRGRSLCRSSTCHGKAPGCHTAQPGCKEVAVLPSKTRLRMSEEVGETTGGSPPRRHGRDEHPKKAIRGGARPEGGLVTVTQAGAQGRAPSLLREEVDAE